MSKSDVGLSGLIGALGGGLATISNPILQGLIGFVFVLWGFLLIAGAFRKPEVDVPAATIEAMEPPAESSALETVPSEVTAWLPHKVETEDFRAEYQILPISVAEGTTHVQRVRLIRKADERHEAEFTIIRLFDDAYWRAGRFDKLYRGDRRPINLNDELDTSRFTELVQDSNFILCIGLASSDGADRSQNESLSHQRAQKICDWLRSGGLDDQTDRILVPVPLGQALDPAEPESAAERAQRSAVIIGIRVHNPLIKTEALYNELVVRTDLENIKLSRYSRAENVVAELESLTEQ